MTIGEFKSFIEGMDIVVHPDGKQWDRILDKLMHLGQHDKVEFNPQEHYLLDEVSLRDRPTSVKYGLYNEHPITHVSNLD